MGEYPVIPARVVKVEIPGFYEECILKTLLFPNVR